MLETLLTRRRFAGSLAAAAASILARPAATATSAAAVTPASTPPGTAAAPAAGAPSEATSRVIPARDIRLDSNENPYGPPESAVRAMAGSAPAAARYPDPHETPLIDDLALHHGVAPENILLGCGSGEILKMADMAFLGQGQKVVAAEPTFEAVLAFAGLARAEATKIPLTAEFRHDLKAMAAACGKETGLVYVCNPNNPTGTIVAGSALAAFLAAVPRHTVVLVDEAYHHFVEDPAYESAAGWTGRYPNLVVVRTFSKIYGLAGMRLGYAIAAPERIEAMRPHAVWSNGNVAVLEAARACLADQAQVARTRRAMNDTRGWLCGELEKDGRTIIPSQTNFVMIDLGTDVQPVRDALAARGIHVGRRFPSMAKWLRVSIGTRDETAAFLAGLREVAPAAAKDTKAA
jgi:histidinol-phosphate aminotransferase